MLRVLHFVRDAGLDDSIFICFLSKTGIKNHAAAVSLQALRGTDQKVRLLFALRLMVITKDQIVDVRTVGLLRNRESSHDVMPPC